jgi:hypothetical protein
MLNWLKWKFAGSELSELERWKVAWAAHDRWLACSFPAIELALRNLRQQAEGKHPMDCSWPPSQHGPWAVDRLREVLHRRFTKPHADDERALADTLKERDNYCKWADKLADAIAEHFGIEIGEHSAGFEANNPWANALEHIENAPRASGVDSSLGGQQ